MAYSASSVRSSINSWNKKINAARKKNAEIDAKIERLQTAKTAVFDIYQDDLSFVNWVDKYDVGTTWYGNKREKFEENKRTAKTKGDTYCTGVHDVYDGICDKIKALEKEKSSGLTTIQAGINCVSSLNNMLSWILRQG